MGRVRVSCSALLLNSVMSAFRAEFVATRSMDFIGMIKECDESGFPKVGRGLSAQRGAEMGHFPEALVGRESAAGWPGPMGEQAKAGSPKDSAEVELGLGLPDRRGGCGPSVQFAPWGAFREDCGLACLKAGLHSLLAKSFVQQNVVAQELDQDVEPARYVAYLRLTCGACGLWLSFRERSRGKINPEAGRRVRP